MTPRPINPPALGAPRGYSNGMLAPAGGQFLCVAGQIAWDASQSIVSTDFVEQFQCALQNVLTVVEHAGGTATDILRLTIYVTNRAEYLNNIKKLGPAYRAVLGRHYPAMALVEVSALVESEARVEIAADAVIMPRSEPAPP